DGIKKGDPPDFKYASVREVSAGTVITTTPPQPPDPTHTCPTGQHWDDIQQICVQDVVIPSPPPSDGNTNVDKFGVRSIYPSTGKRFYDYLLKPNQGLRHNFDQMPKETVNSEVTGYFSINNAPDD